MFNKNNHVMRLAIIALLIALEILLTRVFSIQTPIVRISFGFLPPALIGMLYGPLWSALAYTVGDLIGSYLLPTGPFFPGFTLSAFLTGLIFGLVFYDKKPSVLRCLVASSLVVLFVNLCLDTIWLYMLMDQGLLAILPARLIKAVIILPIMTLVCYTFWSKVISKIPGLQLQ